MLATGETIEIMKTRMGPECAGSFEPQAYGAAQSINGVGVVSVNELNNMVLAGVVEIRFLSAAAAMQRFGGASQEGPVILVLTQ